MKFVLDANASLRSLCRASSDLSGSNLASRATVRRRACKGPVKAAQSQEQYTVRLESLGCPKNVVDGEVLLGDLGKHGFRVTQDSEDVDCVLINTCGFVEDAKAESLNVSPY